jgi:magnesium transporter
MLRHEMESGQQSPRGPADEDSDPGAFRPSPLDRRKTIALQAQEDVCFPQEGLSDIADDEPPAYRMRARRRRGKWPDLSILDEWSRFEKEGRSEERRAKRITEPQLINGRLRPVHRGWFQAEAEAPYRFTYFNEEFQSTIHSQTIAELVQPGLGFKELFIPEPPLLLDSSDSEDEDGEPNSDLHQVLEGQIGDPKLPSRQPSLATTTQDFAERKRSNNSERPPSTDPRADSDHTPPLFKSPDPFRSSSHTEKPAKPLKYGDRPVWWLDIFSPTEAEMKVISKAFGIHPLTAEDIMMQEQREKVELFRNYYFVNYRTFDQDSTSENFLEPVNMYVVVFREGVLSFHFSVTPHPANVRRRIRQLRDYLILSSDWISYAIIDDITDVFGPLIQNIEDEVDDIDYAILQMHAEDDQARKERRKENAEKPDSGDVTSAGAGRDMLRRVGDCRKKVMSLYRLLSNKADVIKGFAKRCNERWEVAPRSEIGLYLGDIQDHIVTMTSNLSHYEK